MLHNTPLQPTAFGGGWAAIPLDGLMDAALSTFLERCKPETWTRLSWPNGFDLDMAAYLSEFEPPDPFVTSARTILLTPQGVARLHNPDGSHILPGGRRSPGESWVEALRREVMEETRCEIENPRPLGFIHIRILSPRPHDYQYPYPDLIQVVYASKGLQVSEEGVDPDGWEERVEFVCVEDLLGTILHDHERVFLDEAIRVFEAV